MSPCWFQLLGLTELITQPMVYIAVPLKSETETKTVPLDLGVIIGGFVIENINAPTVAAE